MTIRQRLEATTPVWVTILTAVVPSIGVILAAHFAREGSITAAQIKADSDLRIAELTNGIADLRLQIEQQNAELDRERFDFEREIERLETDLLIQESALEQQRFEAEQRVRREEAARQYIPMLFSASERDVDIALAMLFVLYPNEAEGMLRSVAESQSEDAGLALQSAIARAASVDELVGEWIVVVANADTLDEAVQFSQIPTGQNYPTTILTLEGFFVVSAGPYATLTDAESAKIGLRTSVSAGAYILNLNTSCPVQIPRVGYVECQLDES